MKGVATIFHKKSKVVAPGEKTKIAGAPPPGFPSTLARKCGLLARHAFEPGSPAPEAGTISMLGHEGGV